MRAQGTKGCDLSLIAVAYAKETTEFSSGNVDGPLLGDLERRHQIALSPASALGLAKEVLKRDFHKIIYFSQVTGMLSQVQHIHFLNFHSQSTNVSKWLKYSNRINGETNHSCEHSVSIVKIQL